MRLGSHKDGSILNKNRQIKKWGVSNRQAVMYEFRKETGAAYIEMIVEIQKLMRLPRKHVER